MSMCGQCKRECVMQPIIETNMPECVYVCAYVLLAHINNIKATIISLKQHAVCC